MPDTAGTGELQQRVERARTGAILGAALGLLAGVGLSFLLAELSGPLVPWLIVTVIPSGFFGATVGHLAGGGRLLKLVNEAAGSDIAAERIKRAVAGEPQDLTTTEQHRAARYAAVAAVALPAQAVRSALLAAALITGQALRLVGGLVLADRSVDLATSALLGLLSALVFAALVPQHLQAGRRARTYAAAHPLLPSTQ